MLLEGRYSTLLGYSRDEVEVDFLASRNVDNYRSGMMEECQAHYLIGSIAAIVLVIGIYHCLRKKMTIEKRLRP